MATVYWRKGKAWARLQRGGRDIRRSLNTEDAEVAARRLGALIKEIDDERSGRGTGNFTVREAVDRFIEDHAPNLKPQAIRRYATSLKWLLPVFGDMLLSQVSSKDLLAFEQARRRMRPTKHAARKVSFVTIKRDFACLSSVFSHAETMEWITHNPVKPYIKGRARANILVESDPRTRYLDHEEERAIVIAGGDVGFAEEITFAIDTGVRAEEQWGLERRDIDARRGRLTVRGELTKNGKTRVIPLLPRALEIARKRMLRNTGSNLLFPRTQEGEAMEHTRAYRQLQKAVEAAGITEHVEWHDLRRTCGCRLLQDHGMTMLEVSKWLGHSSVKVTEAHYAFLSVDHLEKALQRKGAS